MKKTLDLSLVILFRFVCLNVLFTLSKPREEDSLSQDHEADFFQKHPSGNYYVPREEMLLDGKDE